MVSCTVHSVHWKWCIKCESLMLAWSAHTEPIKKKNPVIPRDWDWFIHRWSVRTLISLFIRFLPCMIKRKEKKNVAIFFISVAVSLGQLVDMFWKETMIRINSRRKKHTQMKRNFHEVSYSVHLHYDSWPLYKNLCTRFGSHIEFLMVSHFLWHLE